MRCRDESRARFDSVMAGLDPAIHVCGTACKKDVDARHKAGHDRDVGKLFRRTWPGPLRATQGFERFCHAEHPEIVETTADDLHADRKALRVIAAVDRDG